jgi:hypothetical protein
MPNNIISFFISLFPPTEHANYISKPADYSIHGQAARDYKGVKTGYFGKSSYWGN